MFFSGNPEGSKVGLRLVSSIQISWKLRVSSMQNYYPTVWAFPPMDSPDAPTPRPAPRPSWPWREIINQFIQCFVHQQLVHHTAGNRQQQTVVIYSDIWDGKKCGGKKNRKPSERRILGVFVGSTLSDSLLDLYAWKPLWRYPCFCWGWGGMDTMWMVFTDILEKSCTHVSGLAGEVARHDQLWIQSPQSLEILLQRRQRVYLEENQPCIDRNEI